MAQTWFTCTPCPNLQWNSSYTSRGRYRAHQKYPSLLAFCHLVPLHTPFNNIQLVDGCPERLLASVAVQKLWSQQNPSKTHVWFVQFGPHAVLSILLVHMQILPCFRQNWVPTCSNILVIINATHQTNTMLNSSHRKHGKESKQTRWRSMCKTTRPVLCQFLRIKSVWILFAQILHFRKLYLIIETVMRFCGDRFCGDRPTDP